MIVTVSLPLPRIVVNFSRAPPATVWLTAAVTFAGSFQSDWSAAPRMPYSTELPMPVLVCAAGLGVGLGVVCTTAGVGWT